MLPVLTNWTEKINYFEKYQHVKSNLIKGSLDEGEIDVTIAIPTYNRPKTLKNAIESALRQKGNYNVEIIVVDNCADGNIENERLLQEIIESHSNVLYYRNEENIGMMGNWNRCFWLASAKWVVLLHDDDILFDSYLETVYPWIESTNCTMAGVFHSDLYEEDFEGNIDEKYAKHLGKNQQILNVLRNGKPFLVKYTDIFANVYPAPIASIHQKKAVLELGGFDDLDNAGAGDEKFFVNQIYNGKTIIIPQILAFRGIGTNDTLKPETPKQGIYSKYTYGKYAIKQLGKRKKIRRLNLDVSMKYMANSIEARFNKNVNLNHFLLELGVSKWVVNMPSVVLKVLKYIPLLALIFRATGEIEK